MCVWVLVSIMLLLFFSAKHALTKIAKGIIKVCKEDVSCHFVPTQDHKQPWVTYLYELHTLRRCSPWLSTSMYLTKLQDGVGKCGFGWSSWQNESFWLGFLPKIEDTEDLLLLATAKKSESVKHVTAITELSGVFVVPHLYSKWNVLVATITQATVYAFASGLLYTKAHPTPSTVICTLHAHCVLRRTFLNGCPFANRWER